MIEDHELFPVACYDCGLAYNDAGWIECMVSDEVWSKISPTGHSGGILCITCINRRLRRLKLNKIPVKLLGTESIFVISEHDGF